MTDTASEHNVGLSQLDGSDEYRRAEKVSERHADVSLSACVAEECRNMCGFYGNPRLGGYCYRCCPRVAASFILSRL